MRSADPTTLGARIADARARAGITQVQLAAEVSVDRSALAKIEGGTRRVSAFELARIADAVGERIEWFLADPPAPLVSHRNLKEPGAPSPTIERITRNVEFVAAQDSRFGLADFSALTRPETLEDIESAALTVRSSVGVRGDVPLLDLPARMAELGLLAFVLDLGADTADAASILLSTGGVAIVNGALRVGRRRLALAHELGHLVFADAYSVDWRVAEYDDAGAWETRLDRFARVLLLPATGLREAWSRERAAEASVRTAAVKTASAYRVDMSSLAQRLLELRVVDATDAREIRAVRTNRADIVELNLLVHDEAAAPFLPRPYERSVLRLYRNEIVSAARATDLLLGLWDEADLPALPMRPAGAIWDFV